MKKIYLVRHCETVSQDPESPLTENGYKQTKALAHFFKKKKIDAIRSSPFRRARESIEPLAQQRNIEIIEDERLTERVLSSINLPDWYEKLQETFINKELRFTGGDSSQEAMNRIVNVIEEISKSNHKDVIVVTHGNILALLLHYYDHTFGFKDWEKLRNPDVFVLGIGGDEARVRNIWN